MHRLRKKKDEVEPVSTPEQPASIAVGPFPLGTKFENLASNVWNATQINRSDPYYKFVLLGIMMGLVRPYNQKYDEYTVDQLKTLADMYDTELVRVREALLRKV